MAPEHRSQQNQQLDLSDVTPGGSAGGRRNMEEIELAKARLLDQSFNMKNYRDPLQPLPKSASKSSRGVTAEMELKWLDMIRSANTQP